MALPFDLRAFTASHDVDGTGPDGAGRAPARKPNRPSRAIIIPSEMVARVQARDVEAFRELVRLTYGPLVYFVRTIVQGVSEAEDIVQDVFVFVWDRGEGWNPSGDPAAYLFAMARNYALHEVRRRVREERRIERIGAELTRDSQDAIRDSGVSALDRVVANETTAVRAHIIQKVLAACTERQRTAYELRYHAGLTVPAIAEVLGVTVKSAEQLVRRVTQVVIARIKAEWSEASVGR